MIFFHVVKAYGVGDNKASTGEVLKHTENSEEKKKTKTEKQETKKEGKKYDYTEQNVRNTFKSAG